MENHDYTLLREYLDRGSEAAFAELVSRHTDSVYAAAWRQTGDAEAAKDITQAVFVLLARKASGFRSNIVLLSWLFQTTRWVVAGFRKQESRRRIRETKAAAMAEIHVSPENTERSREEDVAPRLDDALARLGETDRQAVLLHFFEGRTHEQVGRALGLKEDAARKRIGRALEKLRARFFKQGVRLSLPALGAILTAQAAKAAPVDLVAALSKLATGGGAAESGPVAALVQGAIGEMRRGAARKAVAWGASLLLGLGACGWLASRDTPPLLMFKGMSDASAAVALERGLLLAADDEENTLLVYDRAAGGRPQARLDLNAFLQTPRKNPEVDWEGAARIGQRTYWITSHGQNRRGKNRPSRHRLIAAELRWTPEGPELVPVGQPYTNLLADLARAPQAVALRPAIEAKAAPKTRGALNIEGLCATPEGGLWLGFRNPVPQGRAVLAPLLNPGETVEGGAPRFGDLLFIGLGGSGIRDLARVEDRYLILAGAIDGKREHALYEWFGPSHQPRLLAPLAISDLNPEALVAFPDLGSNRLLLLSDDGTRTVWGSAMKTLPPAWRSFRGCWLKWTADPAGVQTIPPPRE